MSVVPVMIEKWALERGWNGFAHLIAKACLNAPSDLELHNLRERAESGSLQLWAAYDTEAKQTLAIVGTEIGVGFDNKLFCRCLFGVGSERERWQGFMADLKAWAKERGCQRMAFQASPAWFRILRNDGYRMTHVMLECDL